MGSKADRERIKAALNRNLDMRARARNPNSAAVHEAWIRFYRRMLQQDAAPTDARL